MLRPVAISLTLSCAPPADSERGALSYFHSCQSLTSWSEWESQPGTGHPGSQAPSRPLTQESKQERPAQTWQGPGVPSPLPCTYKLVSAHGHCEDPKQCSRWASAARVLPGMGPS